jgi:site-specific recombinase XerD
MTVEPTGIPSILKSGEILEQYRAELERLAYSRGTVKTYLRVVQKLCQHLDARGLALADLTPDRAAGLIQEGAARNEKSTYKAFIARRFATFLVSLGVAEPPSLTPRELALAALRRDYENYLRRHRGLSERTIYHCWRLAERFLAFRFGKAEPVLDAITPGDVVAFLQKLTTHKSRSGKSRCRVSSLRQPQACGA